MSENAENLYRQAQRYLSKDKPDYHSAVPLLQQAAQSHSEAAFQLAACLMNGTGIAPDFSAGVGYLKQAAESGHSYARYNLLQLRESEGADIAELLPAYTELAEDGLLPAQLRLMRACNEAGDRESAVSWAQQAAAQNHPQAQYFLAQHYQHCANPDFPRARELYSRAAEQGFVAAHWQLGLQYKLAQGVEQDLALAEKHLTAAAQHGIAAAQTALAEILLHKDSGQALYWFQTASKQGDNDAHAALAEIYLQGRFAERRPELARRHAEAAAQNYHAEALRLLGDIYRYGLGVPADADVSRRYYRQAADLGSVNAHGKILSDSALNDQENYEQTKTLALRQQKSESFYQQALAAHYGLNRSRDYAEALLLYRQAALLGNSKAQTNIGMMYYSGQGVAADFAQAAKWFESAALQNNGMAQYNLACLYFHGAGVAKSPRQACKWLQKAIAGGYGSAEELGKLLKQWQQAV